MVEYERVASLNGDGTYIKVKRSRRHDVRSEYICE